MKREKQRDVFVKLINKILEPHNKRYEDVVGDPMWYTRYETTKEQERDFSVFAKSLIMTELELDEKRAENEVSWFLLQWGLKTSSDVLDKKTVELFKSKEVNKVKKLD